MYTEITLAFTLLKIDNTTYQELGEEMVNTVFAFFFDLQNVKCFKTDLNEKAIT